MDARLSDIPTPALILDRERLARNAAAMTSRMRRHGVSLRPHLKTAKSARVAEVATEGNAGGITVSTLREAEYFVEHGFRDITYAVCIVPDRVPRVADLQRDGARVSLITDDAGVARSLSERAVALDAELHVLVEVDTGLHRTGVEPSGPDLLEIAGILHAAPGVALEGVLTHAGHSYHCRDADGVRAVGEQERAGVARAARRLREAGLPCPTVSAGSTPTAVHAASLEGVTEMRPGNYLFFDLFQEGIGSCRRGEIALTVLSTVLGHQRAAGRIVVDAGSLALSSDTSANEHRPVRYGLVLDETGRPLEPALKVTAVNQEHGILQGGTEPPFDRLPIGSQVRILPNHACLTAAMFDRYHVVEEGRGVVDTWERTNRW